MNWRERGWEIGLGSVILLCVGVVLHRHLPAGFGGPTRLVHSVPADPPAAAGESLAVSPSAPSLPRPESLPIIEEIRRVHGMLKQDHITVKQTLKQLGTGYEKPHRGDVVNFTPTNPIFKNGGVGYPFEGNEPDAVDLAPRDPRMLRLSDLRAAFGQGKLLRFNHPEPFDFEFWLDPPSDRISCRLIATALIDHDDPEALKMERKVGLDAFRYEDVDWPVQEVSILREVSSK